ncbi:MAG: T9SS type A sorting domain-containing protein [Fulvivirga sp.]
MIFKNKILFLLTFSIYGSVHAQNSISSTGGSIESDTGNVSYSIGQVFFSNISDDNVSLYEGVIQIEELYKEVVGFEEYTELSLSAFPNPTARRIIINWEESYIESINYYLINENGQAVMKGVLDSINNQIDMSNLPPSVYYLSILNGKNQYQNFKIVKSN